MQSTQNTKQMWRYPSFTAGENRIWYPTKEDKIFFRTKYTSTMSIFQARVLEWVSISFSRGSSPPRIKPGSPALQADALRSKPPGKSLCLLRPNNCTLCYLSKWGQLIFTQKWKVKVKSLSCVQLFSTPWIVAHGIFQARVLGCHFLLQGIFLTQGSKLGLPHCRQRLYLWATRYSQKMHTQIKTRQELTGKQHILKESNNQWYMHNMYIH